MLSSSHQLPPFFKRGPSPLVRLVFFLSLSLILLFIDLRFRYLEVMRQTIAVVTHPLQHIIYAPLALAADLAESVTHIGELRQNITDLRLKEMQSSLVSQRQEQLDRENEQLRQLLDMKQRLPVKGTAAEILYNVRDPFSRKVLINKGSQDGISPGQAVVDKTGVVGQITRSYPFQAEVTLITHKDQGVPVQLERNGLRSVVFGNGDGQLELRFMAANADVKEGDILETSGLDEVYSPGLPVAKVVSMRRDAAYSFAHILCSPLAGVENSNLVLVLSAPDKPAPPPEPEEAKPTKSKKGRKS